MITDERLQELRRLAEAATPGPWWVELERTGPYAHDAYIAFSYATPPHPSETYDLLEMYNVDTDYAYIAGAHPATTIALLDEIERLRAERDNLATALEAIANMPSRTLEGKVDRMQQTAIHACESIAWEGQKGD